MSIPFPDSITKQLPYTNYKLLQQLSNDFSGIPFPPTPEAIEQAIALADTAIASPVFDEPDKAEVRKWKETLEENCDDWTRIRDPFNPLYRVLVQMQEEIQSLRHELRRTTLRLEAYDEARLNHARRLVGMPAHRSFKSGTSTPTTNPRFASPAIIDRLSADRLRDALEAYLSETPPFDVSRNQMQRALKVCCGMEDEMSA